MSRLVTTYSKTATRTPEPPLAAATSGGPCIAQGSQDRARNAGTLCLANPDKPATRQLTQLRRHGAPVIQPGAEHTCRGTSGEIHQTLHTFPLETVTKLLGVVGISKTDPTWSSMWRH
eukprot:4078049-Pyramimonas_sp.AAC.1